MNAKKFAQVVGGVLLGNGEVGFSGVSIDSRKIKKGEVFFALKGSKHDGHNFIGDALARGAVGAVVEKEMNPPKGKFYVKVSSTLDSLKALAVYKRSLFRGDVIGIAGSVGKTTTKELIYYLLSQVSNTYRSEGNLNSSIGLPLVMSNMPLDCEYAVLELGASALGDVLRLARIARPRIRVITAIGEEHLETFGSLENIIKGNGEILTDFGENDFAVIPAYTGEFYSLPRERVITFGSGGDLRAERVKLSLRGTSFLFEGEEFTVPVLSPGIVENLLASFGVLKVLGYDPRDFKESVLNFQPPEGRMRLIKGEGFYLIDDTYNANPPSVRNALRALSSIKAEGKRIAVLGDMLELGRDSANMHREVGALVVELGIERALFYGDMMREAYEECLRRGGVCFYYSKKEDLRDEVLKCMRDNNIILVKGSRGMRMEQLIRELGEPASHEP